MNQETQHELEISSLAHDGRGIGFLDGENGRRGKAVFIEGALPGQRVLFETGKDHGSWLEGTLDEILDQGGNVVAPHCPQSGKCGGCPLQPMPYERQLVWKERLALDALARIGGFSGDKLKRIWKGVKASPDLTAFRNKIELAFAVDEKGRPYPGMRRRSSHEVLPCASCALIDSTGNEILRNFSELLGLWDWSAGFWRFLVLRRDQDVSAMNRWRAVAILRPNHPADMKKVRELGKKLLASHPAVHAFIAESRASAALIAKGEKRVFAISRDNNKDGDAATMNFRLLDRHFSADATSFFQVNDGASEKLTNAVLEADSHIHKKRVLLDLYCGVGAPGLLLAHAYQHSLGLEIDAAAIAHARENARDLPNAQFKAGNVAKILRKLPQPFDREISTLLADPPRSGMDRQTVRQILELAPENIIMVSCNPTTMARDAKLLGEMYELQSLKGIDLFPHTPHVECCGLWSRK